MVADNRPSKRVVSDEENADLRVSRRSLVTTGALISTAMLFGRPAAAQTDVTVAFSDETAAPGDQVSVALTIAEADSPDTQISGYEFDIGFNESILSFVDAKGIDMDGPVTNEPGPGELTVNAVNTDGVAVTLTAAELVFEVDGSVNPGSVSVVSILDGELLNRNVEQVLFTGSDGSVTASNGEEDRNEGDDEEENEDENESGGMDNDDNGDENDNGDDGFGPGFGVGSALTALGGVSYILHRRFTGETDNH